MASVNLLTSLKTLFPNRSHSEVLGIYPTSQQFHFWVYTKETIKRHILDFPGGLMVINRPCAANAEDTGLIPDEGTKIPDAAPQGHKIKSKPI